MIPLQWNHTTVFRREVIKMKIAIPTMGMNGIDEVVGQHFGSSPTYTIYDTETNQAESMPNTSRHVGGQGYPPELLHSLGVNVLICKGLGIKAVEMFKAFEIDVLVGAQDTVRDTIELWKKGVLETASLDNACKGHQH